MLFINTRPSDRAQSLTQQLQQLGHDVFEFPLLSLKPLDLNIQLADQFLKLHCVDVIVVVSPTAASIGLQYLKDLNIPLQALSKVHWIAVGEKTAQVLADVGIQASVPTVENSEGMLQLPILQNHQIKATAFWRGIGGRQFMMAQLLEQGVHVLNMLLYQRALPQCASKHAELLFKTLDSYLGSVFVCMTSEASWKNWQYICAQHHLVLEKFNYLPLGQRLTQLLEHDLAQQVACIYPISDLKPATIHTAMLQGPKK